jgi:hypothetical protein
MPEYKDCGSLKVSYDNMLLKIKPIENSVFFNLLLANHAKYLGRSFGQLFLRAANIDHGDIYLTEELKKAGVTKAEDNQGLYKNLVEQLEELRKKEK